MSFSPLPATFLDDLRWARGRTVVELGCGDGRFTAVLRRHGARPVGLDRRRPAAGSAAAVVADARRLPLREGSVALLVAANLLRQLWPLPGRAAVPADWQRCLAPGGRLWVFEDEPTARPASARNYRDLQAFLARLDVWSRRPLLARAEFLRCLGGGPAADRWRCDAAANAERPGDLGPLLAGLESGGDEGEGRRLAAAIRRHGLAYGDFWWARWQGEAA